jgi:hypothetical protein
VSLLAVTVGGIVFLPSHNKIHDTHTIQAIAESEDDASSSEFTFTFITSFFLPGPASPNSMDFKGERKKLWKGPPSPSHFFLFLSF